MTDEDILREIDGMEVGQKGSMELHVYCPGPGLPNGCVRTENFGMVSEDVYVGDDDRICFGRNGKTFRGKLRSVASTFKFGRTA